MQVGITSPQVVGVVEQYVDYDTEISRALSEQFSESSDETLRYIQA